MGIISTDTEEKLKADTVVMREHECFSYQTNIDNYTAILDDLPKGEWPVELEQYRNTLPSDIPLEVDLEIVQRVNDYQLRDRTKLLIRTEHCEMNKSHRLCCATKKAMKGTDAEKETKIADASARYDEELAARKS